MPSVTVEEHAPGCYEKARLRVAHAETLLPFSCLIWLFLEESGECFHSHISKKRRHDTDMITRKFSKNVGHDMWVTRTKYIILYIYYVIYNSA